MKATIGLEPAKVRVAPHSREWRHRYETERAMLAAALGDLAVDIQHVGSTAVPGLAAKPIIDIAIAVAAPSAAAPVAAILNDLGYRFAIDAGGEGGLIFFREPEPPLRTHHVHVVSIDDPQWRNYLRFRDCLRADARLRAEYAALKERLAETYADDRPGYTEAKTEFVRAALASSRDQDSREPDSREPGS